MTNCHLTCTQASAGMAALTSKFRKPSCRLLPLTSLLLASLAHADQAPTQGDFGGASLWQTPSARMATEGEFALTASHVHPYDRYNLSLQPLPWLEGIVRYTAVSNRLYGATSLSGHQSYKDKSIDVKLRLWTESRYLPEVSIGARDIGGTGLFSGEYLVTNKRFGALDVSLGLGWGYVGARGNLKNPLSIISTKFDARPDHQGTGKFSSNAYFRGPSALFGGITYQTPWNWLLLKAEYDGNSYHREPLHNTQHQDSTVNFGAVFRPSRNLDLSIGYERGKTVMAGVTLHANVAEGTGPAKQLDPPPSKRTVTPDPPGQPDWVGVARDLRSNAGIQVSRIARRGSEVVVTGEQRQYFYSAKGVGRTARILDNALGKDTNWITLATEQEGLVTAEISVPREGFTELLDHDISLTDLHRNIALSAPAPAGDDTLYSPAFERLEHSFALAYGQNLGGPDAFLLYRVAAIYNLDFHLTKNLWWSSAVSLDLADNYDKFKYDAPSQLPRVRTDIRKYVTTSTLTIPVFQLTATRQLGEDLFGMAYGGMIESMFGGIGGEILYRPFGERWAVGSDLNWVKQRDYSQNFSFLRYQVVTGHVTGYFKLGYQNLTLAIRAGRYLAGDWGMTVDVSREFRNGVRMGAFATKTNVSAKQFGEGSFDKGVYVSIPFDLMLPKSTIMRATVVWDPLIRDGGAGLGKRYSLYSLTSDRDLDNFNANFNKIVE